MYISLQILTKIDIVIRLVTRTKEYYTRGTPS